MRSRNGLVISALFLLMPFVCFGQTPESRGARGEGQPDRGTVAPARRGGTPETSGARGPAQRRPSRGLLKVQQLPTPSMSGSMTVEAALSKIQSLAPALSDQPLKVPEIGQLAWAAQGRPVAPTTPVAAVDERALLKVFFVLPDGFYLYVPPTHSLQEIRDIDLRPTVSSRLLGQQNAPIGGCQIVVGGSVKDFNARYGNRARNIMLLLAGQMVQNMQLEAAALDLTSVGINSVDTKTARGVFGYGNDVEPLYLLLVGYPSAASTTGTGAGTSQTPPAGSFKKAVIIAPQNGFQDVEFFETRRLLESNSVQVTVASLGAGPIRSMSGAAVQADLAIHDVHPADYSAIILVGGPGTQTLFNTRPLWDLIREAATQRKVIAAIDNAPAILAAAGAIKGTRVTGSPDTQGVLVTAGAGYTGSQVEKDGPLVTAMGPQFTPLFVQAILDGMNGK